MRINEDEARELLREHGLRATGPRVAIVLVLAQAPNPLSHSEVLEHLGETEWDPSTIYRNLVKLRDSGVAPMVSRADGVDRYAFDHGDGHRHPHFFCEICGRVTCLPEEVTASLATQGAWAPALRTASVHLHGTCPDCLERGDTMECV
ncbi:MAG: transcriptional repressor [Myxococcota bacterium]